MDNNICDYGICLESINSKHIDNTIQLECGHWFHSKCISTWCLKYIDNNNDNNNYPTCPLCCQTISNEYFDILGIDYFTDDNNFTLSINTIQLFTHIMNNKLYKDEKKLQKYIEKYPSEMSNVMLMLEFYIR